MDLLQKLSGWYFSKKALPYWCILVFDCALVCISGYLGYYLEMGGDAFAGNFWQMTYGLLLGLIPFIVAFRLLHTYSGIVRYSSFIDLQRVATAVLFGAAIDYFLGLAVNAVWPEQRAVLFPDLSDVFSTRSIPTMHSLSPSTAPRPEE